jgi:hypothetical protein
VANGLVDTQSLVLALMIIYMIVGIGYKCLMWLTHITLCVWCCCKWNNGSGNYGLLWGQMVIEPNDFGSVILMVVDCLSLKLNNIVDHHWNKLK